jgi:serine/threonine protein kinase
MQNSDILFGRYRPTELAHQALFREIWHGVHANTGQGVIITIFTHESLSSPDILTQLETLTTQLTILNSPYGVPLLACGEEADNIVSIQAAVEGQPLAEILKAEQGLALDLVLDIAQQAGEFLQAVHHSQTIHGGLNPDTIYLTTQGTIQILDTGLAQIINLSHLLASGQLDSTPYHSPEIRAGKPLTPQSDYYALGALLYEVLTGKEPKFDSPDFYPSSIVPGLPPELDELVNKCLAPEPNHRIQSAVEFNTWLDEIQSGLLSGGQDTVLGMEDILVGHTLGAYQLTEKLGQGGMATVYKAYESTLDRYVAIKVLPQFFARDQNFMTRFRREARAVAQLNHPNIVPIHSFGEQDSITYIAMQYVIGNTLKQERGNVYAPEQALKLTIPIARALAYAHQRGIIHRDIKPSNILLTEDDWPLLADFGLAKMADTSEGMTGTGVGVGTPMYMSPEQGQGTGVDQRTDIYSLGIMLYEMLTGDVPFKADTPMAIVIKHMTAPMPMPRQINPNIPEELERVILKATAKNPTDRYQTAEEMAATLEATLALLATNATPDSAQSVSQAAHENGDRGPMKTPVSRTVIPIWKQPLAIGIFAAAVLIIFGIVFIPRLFTQFGDQTVQIPGAAVVNEITATNIPTSDVEITPTIVAKSPIVTSVAELAIQIALDAIQSQEPTSQHNFDYWDLGVPVWNVKVEDGKLIASSEGLGQPTYINLGKFSSDMFAVEFDLSISELEPASDEGRCYFDVKTDDDTSESRRSLLGAFSPSGIATLDHYVHPDQWPVLTGNTFEISDSNTVTLIFLGEKIIALVDGRTLFTATDPDGSAIYYDHGIFAEGNIVCAYDNYKFWDLGRVDFSAAGIAPTLDPALKTALDATQNENPLYQTSFDSWDLVAPQQNASLENGKLIVAGRESQSTGVHQTDFHSDRFAVEYEVQILESSQQGGACLLNIAADNEYGIRTIFWPRGEVEVDHLEVDSYEVTIGYGKFDPSNPSTVRFIVIDNQFSLFIDGQLAFTAPDPEGSAVYTNVNYEADSQMTCEFDNYKFWDLSDADFSEGTTLDPATQAALNAIQNHEPTYQTNFDSWEFESLGPNAQLEAGKLIITSENDQHVSVDMPNLDSDQFVIEFEVRALESTPDSHCVFYTHDGSDVERILASEFHMTGGLSLFVGTGQDQQEYLANSKFDIMKSNTVTLVVLGDQIATIVNGELAYTAIAPGGSVVYSSAIFAATYTTKCEYDNVKIWNLDEVDFSAQEETPAFYDPILTYIDAETPSFEEDFSTPKTYWIEHSPNKLDDNERLEDVITDGVIRLEGNAAENEFLDYGFNFEGIYGDNFVLQFDFTPYSKLWGTAVQFHTDDKLTGDTYIFRLVVDEDKSDWQLERHTQAGRDYSLQEGEITPHIIDETHTLQLIAYNDQYGVLLNDVLLASFDGVQFSAEDVGIGAHSGERLLVDLDNIKSWNLDGIDL